MTADVRGGATAASVTPAPQMWPLYAAGFTTAFGAHGLAANLGGHTSRDLSRLRDRLDLWAALLCRTDPSGAQA
ncbi:hypothetical protein ACFC0P_17115, partial [Streptomyces broussonetiae]